MKRLSFSSHRCGNIKISSVNTDRTTLETECWTSQSKQKQNKNKNKNIRAICKKIYGASQQETLTV